MGPYIEVKGQGPSSSALCFSLRRGIRTHTPTSISPSPCRPFLPFGPASPSPPLRSRVATHAEGYAPESSSTPYLFEFGKAVREVACSASRFVLVTMMLMDIIILVRRVLLPLLADVCDQMAVSVGKSSYSSPLFRMLSLRLALARFPVILEIGGNYCSFSSQERRRIL